MPNISAIMPVKNGSMYIEDTINSIKSQSYKDWELIIVDDHSEDNTREIVERFISNDSRIKLIEQDHNSKGVAAALNKALTYSNGDYIVRIDADDICHFERFQKQLDYMDLNLNVGVLGSSVSYIDSKGFDVGYGDKFISDLECKWYLLFHNPFYHPSVMIRRDVINSVDGYRNVKSEDLDLWHRLSNRTNFHNLPERLLYYRIHDAQISKTLYKEDNNRDVYSVRLDSLKMLSESLALSYTYSVFMASRNRGSLSYSKFISYFRFIVRYSVVFCKKHSSYRFLFKSLLFGFKQIAKDSKHLLGFSLRK